MKPTLLEFAGLPGSGKTTISRNVMGRLAAQNIRVGTVEGQLFGSRYNEFGVGQKIIHRLQTIVQEPKASLLAYYLSFSTRSSPLASVVATQAILEAVRVLSSVRDGSLPDIDLLISDELLLHRLFCIYFGQARKPLFGRLLKSLMKLVYSSLPHRVVYIDTTPEVCVERFLNRDSPGSRFGRHTSSKMTATFLQDNTCREIFQTYSATTNVPAIVLDGNQSIEQVTDEAVATVAPLFDGTGGT